VSEERPLPQAPAQRGRDRELWVGLFVIGGVAATLIVLFTMTNAALFRGRYIVTTVVKDAAGIRKGDPVLMRGVNIGRVLKFDIDKDQVALRLEIEGEYRVPKDSRVEIKSIGLLGGMAADVLPGQSSELIHGGQTLPGGVGPGVLDKVNELSGSADQALARVQALLSDTTVRNVEASSIELNGLLKELHSVTSEQRGELQKLTTSLRQTTESLQKATSGPELEQSVKRMDAITKQLDDASASFARSSRLAEAIMARIDRGEGALGKLSKDEALYTNANEAVMSLNKAAAEMAKLAEDVRQQPKKYLKFSVF
jgi:phospholipid/cholesterol/gamma-HCH transport system substrate-binding protein